MSNRGVTNSASFPPLPTTTTTPKPQVGWEFASLKTTKSNNSNNRNSAIGITNASNETRTPTTPLSPNPRKAFAAPPIECSLIDLAKAIEVLKGPGMKLLKFGNQGKPHKRLFKISKDYTYLQYESPTKSDKSKTIVFFKDVHEIIIGQKTKKFQRLAGKYDDSAHLCFSIVYGINDETLDVSCENEAELKLWINCLSFLVREAQLSFDQDPMKILIMKLWMKTDVNHDNQASFNEIKQMLKDLNINIKSSVLKQKFKFADDNDNGHLEFDEFIEFYNSLRERREIEALFNQYVPKDSRVMSPANFLEFLHKEQKDTHLTLDDCRRFMRSYGSLTAVHQEGFTLADFTSFLYSHLNSAFNPRHYDVYQDMTQPLSSYFINSSHNTYLAGDQLQGESSVEMYRKALTEGCRCVELDCWDGPDGDPIIYHGHTLTSKIKFRDVIQCVEDFGFITNPYPVILSLEVHCSIEQQKVMAEIMRTIFGDKLQLRPQNFLDLDRLPSPEELKGKVLVKGKIVGNGSFINNDGTSADANNNNNSSSSSNNNNNEGEEDDDDSDDSDYDNDETTDNNTNRGAMDFSEIVVGLDDDSDADGDDVVEEIQHKNESKRAKAEAKKAKKENSKNNNSNSKKKQHHKIAQELSDLVYLCATGFKGLDHLESAFYMHSFSETKAAKFIKKSSFQLIEYNKRQLSRIYPMGTRFDSSNYNPIPAWNTGCQLVAINLQTKDRYKRINDGKFAQNGNCGYILKPQRLRMVTTDPSSSSSSSSGAAADPRQVLKLTVKVISGSQLPGNEKTQRDIIDPFVELRMLGEPADKVAYKTRHVPDNGFNPVWNETFEFNLTAADLALLHFKVYDKNTAAANVFLAENIIPLESLRAGYRSVLLKNRNGNLFYDSSLLCHFRFD